LIYEAVLEGSAPPSKFHFASRNGLCHVIERGLLIDCAQLLTSLFPCPSYK
jgi:hypothetical protein